MKNLNDLKEEVDTQQKNQILNKERNSPNVVLFAVVTLATLLIPTCGVFKKGPGQSWWV